MNEREAQAVNRVLHHLAGTVVYDETDLEDDIDELAYAAGSATGIPSGVDVEDVLTTLGEVAQRHADRGL